MKPLRVLQIISNLEKGSGVAQVVLNWHRNIDTTKVQFDYLCFKTGDTDLENEVRQKGGNVYCIPYKGIAHSFSFIKQSIIFFKEHRYQILHSHITHLNLIFYPLAKMFGVKHIIQHAHGTKWSDKKLNGWRNYLMLHAVWPLITHKLACSQLAGEFWYKKNFTVINNGIDVEKFSFNPNIRQEKRKELGIENNFIVANIGRFNLEKNHKFLIEIFTTLAKKDKTAKLVLVGSGPLEKDIKALSIAKKIQDKVIFLGNRKDVSDLLQAFDVLCMPSFHEGLPVAGVEAQGTGLPCVFADTITKEVIILPNSKMLSLKDKAEKWAEVILSLKSIKRNTGKECLQKKNFDIQATAQTIQEFYLSTGN